MATLAREVRRDLEKTVKNARRVAAGGTRKALEQLGVHHHEPYGSMTPEQRALRNRLRAHGRQLGDRRDRQKGTQTIDRLIQECAYQHWHRMLFARFLAETDLLIEPQSDVAITLEECQELAREQGTDWLALASDYAERMLPQIFRTDDPALAITMPPETLSDLEDLLKSLPRDVFTADDSLGWVYQFWQADKKDEVNRSETKIGADELPAVTQLFTEDYMVLFLLHNTLGAWWAGKVLDRNPELAASSRTEDELRAACKVGDLEWTYLRFVRRKVENGIEGPWRPAAGTFDGWPEAAKDLTVLDPCMGSGHFLVFALPILVAFRIAEESLDEIEAIDAVLIDNLFGLEIDSRCTQIAAFNLAFAVWQRIGFRALPALNIACSGLAIGVSKTEWLKLAEKAAAAADLEAKHDLLALKDDLLTQGLEVRVKNGLDALYELFAQAPWLGSLIDPRLSDAEIFREGFEKLEPLLAWILAEADTEEAKEIAVTAQGMAKAAEVLAKKFSLVVTNVPYLARGRQDHVLRSFCAAHFDDAKPDLATVFIERCIRFNETGGCTALVTPQNWLFLDYYKRLRKRLLKEISLHIGVEMGPGAFEMISGEVVQAVLLCVERTKPNNGGFFALNIADTGYGDKAHCLVDFNAKLLSQMDFLRDTDAKVLFQELENSTFLSEYAEYHKGLCTGDDMRFKRVFWEVSELGSRWSLYQGSPDETNELGGLNYILLWDQGRGELVQFVQERLASDNISAWIRGTGAWGRPGVTIRCLGDLPATRYLGTPFDTNVAVITPKQIEHMDAIWAYCASDDYRKAVRIINRKMNVGDASLIKIPFDLVRWTKEAKKHSSDDRASLETADPIQFVFSGDPARSSNALVVGTLRLMGYQWPRQKSVTVLNVSSISPDGLCDHADEDGIVVLTPLKGEAPAEQRLNVLLMDAYGSAWSAAKLASLLSEVGFAGKSLEDWLRDGFFEQHCTLFRQRPFIWHIWDGRRDGFHALVNYHRLAAPNGEGRRTLEKLIYSYLGDWIDRQRADQIASVEGADARLAHAEHLRGELTRILEGEPPYDIYIRWKTLHQQPIGWNPDINDGVRINIRPFMTARPLGARAKNACILRATPKIKWQKDRGKEPMRDKEDYPWFWNWDEATANFAGGDTFDGNRWNDLHYSSAFKQAARERHAATLEGKT